MKIALIGYGKMGKTIEKIALERGHEIVSIIDIDNREDFGSEAFKSADVAIEFTAPTVAFDNCMKAMDAGVKVVSGSTGWFQQHEAEMRSRLPKTRSNFHETLTCPKYSSTKSATVITSKITINADPTPCTASSLSHAAVLFPSSPSITRILLAY